MAYPGTLGSKSRFQRAQLGAGVLFLWLAANTTAPAETAQVLPLNLSIEYIGTATSMARQDDGKLIVGGSFQLANGATRYNLARFNPDGTLDSGWKPQPDNEVRVVTVSGTNIYVGGTFDTIGGISRAHFAKLDYTTGAADPDWNPAASAVVRAIVVKGSYLYVAGAFTSIGGLARTYVARLHAADGSADPAWSATLNRDLETLAVNDSHIYVSGSFDTVDGLARPYLARLSALNGNCDPVWNPIPDWMAFTILLNGTDIYVGGGFTTINGVGHAYLAQLNATDGAPTTWTVNANDPVRTLTAFGDYMIVGGEFSAIGSSPRAGLALVHFSGYTEITWTNGVIGRVNSAAVNGTNEVYIGGWFQTGDANPAWSIERLDPTSGARMTAFHGRINNSGSIYAIARQADGKIVLGGSFLAINGNGLTNLCRLNSDYTLDTAFQPNPDSVVRALQVDDTGIYAGGRFSTIGGVPRANLAKLTLADGSVDTSFWADTDANVYTLALDFNTLYVGGDFTTIGGQSRNRLAKLYPEDGTVDSTFNLGADGAVFTVFPSGASLWAAGAFTTIGGGAHNRIAKLDANTGAADPAFTLGADNDIYTLAGEETEFYAGGDFTAIGGAAHNCIAKLNPDTGAADPQFTTDSSTYVSSLAFTFYDLYIGGVFTNISGITRRGLAQLDIATGAVTPWVADTDSIAGYVRAILHAGAYLLVGGDFTDINGVNSPCFAVITRHGPPAVTLTAPADGQRIVALGMFELSASATATTNVSGIAITQVAFYANGSLVGTLTGEPYELTATNVPEGSYSLTAQAWDSDGLCATSTPVVISVTPLPVPGDYDGDRKADPALFVNAPNPGLVGNWYAWLSGSGYRRVGPYAISPVRQQALGADFDGDQLADPAACYSDLTGLVWNAWLSSANYSEVGPVHFGQSDATPLAADFDGDRKADPACVDAAGSWTAWLSSRGYAPVGPYTTFSGVELPLTADFDGDGKADPAGYRAGVLWAWLSGSGYSSVSAPLYVTGGIPAAADYDGDGKADPAVYVPATGPGTSGAWYAWLSTAGYALSGPFPLTAP